MAHGGATWRRTYPAAARGILFQAFPLVHSRMFCIGYAVTHSISDDDRLRRSCRRTETRPRASTNQQAPQDDDIKGGYIVNHHCQGDPNTLGLDAPP